MATAAGLQADECGGKCRQIGGPTDLRGALGDGGEADVWQWGRCASDVARVYQHAVVDHQPRASASMGDATGMILEALCAGWSQPVTFR
mmetsp:Transcript_4557/g.9992  ORF Transcript_4557/g.9992 Transcript_4557/m.9992 type:complete len:89 (-) Transcript_4557:168-434(-)